MCGLLVYYDLRGVEEKSFSLALSSLHHRGPDGRGLVKSLDGKIMLGHNRLAIIDVNPRSSQPMPSPCGRWILLLNGEIYNYRHIRSVIGNKWNWKTESDTEVFLAWYLECRNSQKIKTFLDAFEGMFAFAIYDTKLKSILFGRDRFGIKPLYYYLGQNKLILSSEIPPILRLVKTAKPNLSTIRRYLENGSYDDCSDTFFEGVSSLPSGHVATVTLDNLALEISCWYELEKHVKPCSHISKEALIDELAFLIDDSIESHLISDVPVGFNLSGGLDSTVLITRAKAFISSPAAFTQEFPGYEEFRYIKPYLEDVRKEVITLSCEQIHDVIEETVRIQGEPFGGISVCAYYYLYKRARELGIKVLLDGNGIDECFLGYKKYHQIYTFGATSEHELNQRRRDYELAWGEKSPRRVSLGSALDGSVGTAPGAISPALLKQTHEPHTPRTQSFQSEVKNLAYDDLIRKKIPRSLRFNDRMSMAHSCELRVPFLNHKLVEFAFSLPITYCFGPTGSKNIVRELASNQFGIHPSDAFSPKRMVQNPQREWFGNEWKSTVLSILSSKRFKERGWIDPMSARTIFENYLSGEKSNSAYIWQWMNLELWARQFLD